jgi:hypothetical protein
MLYLGLVLFIGSLWVWRLFKKSTPSLFREIYDEVRESHEAFVHYQAMVDVQRQQLKEDQASLEETIVMRNKLFQLYKEKTEVLSEELMMMEHKINNERFGGE